MWGDWLHPFPHSRDSIGVCTGTSVVCPELQAAEAASVQRLQAAITDKDAQLRDAQGLIEQLLAGGAASVAPVRGLEVHLAA